MIRIVAIVVLCIGSFPEGAFAEVNDPHKPLFIKSEAECLRLQNENVMYSKVALVEAQYQWLRDNYLGYKFRAHMKPKPEYAKKLGCETQRGSILRIDTADGEEVTVCFCLPANQTSDPVSLGEAG